MGYRLIADENVDREVPRRLERLGHEVLLVESAERLEQGMSDRRLLQVAAEQDYLLVTHDKDFVVEFQVTAPAGVLYVDSDRADPAVIAGAIDRMSEYHPQDDVHGIEHVDRWL